MLAARLSALVLAMFFAATACQPEGATTDGDGGPGDADADDQNDGSTDASDDGSSDSSNDGSPPGELVTIRGTIWSPGADNPAVLENNRFPIPGAAVIAYTSRPADIPQERYCNECVEIPVGTPNTLSDPITGEFELRLTAGMTYFLTVQKGEFRRVREYTVPDTAGQTVDLTWDANGPRPELTTLPNRTNLEGGDNIPKIAMIRGGYENMRPMFDVLGFEYDHDQYDFDIYCAWNPLSACPGPGVNTLLNDPATLNQYNLIIVSCGEDWPGGSAQAADNLRQWVMDGGSLYVDDFNYDFVERPWPDFLSWYVSMGGEEDDDDRVCADGGNEGVGHCNNWSEYDFDGAASDVPDFAAWLELPEVNRGEPLRLFAAWDYIHGIGAGLVGVDESGAEIRQPPRVWMYNENSVPFGDFHVPATVSWPYYCGRALYTVYHTHSSGAGADYELLLQEKIMMYLIMEVQTCATEDLLY